jgi:hypothetical protein
MPAAVPWIPVPRGSDRRVPEGSQDLFAPKALYPEAANGNELPGAIRAVDRFAVQPQVGSDFVGRYDWPQVKRVHQSCDSSNESLLFEGKRDNSDKQRKGENKPNQAGT